MAAKKKIKNDGNQVLNYLQTQHPGDGPRVRNCGNCEGLISGLSPDHEPFQCIERLQDRLRETERRLDRLENLVSDPNDRC